MLARTATPKILSSDHNLIVRLGRLTLDELLRILIVRKTDQRITPKLLVFVGLRRHQRQILGRNDLVRIDVVTDDENRAGDGIGHKSRTTNKAQPRAKGNGNLPPGR